MIACNHVALWWLKLTPELININMLTAEHLAQPLCLNTAWGSRLHGSRLQLHCLSSPIFSILFIYFMCSQPLTSKPMADIFYILTSTKDQTSSCCFQLLFYMWVGRACSGSTVRRGSDFQVKKNKERCVLLAAQKTTCLCSFSALWATEATADGEMNFSHLLYSAFLWVWHWCKVINLQRPPTSLTACNG